MSGVQGAAAGRPQVVPQGGFNRAGGAGRPGGAGKPGGFNKAGGPPEGFTPPEGFSRADGAAKGGFSRPSGGGNPGERLQASLEAAGYDQATIDQVTSDVQAAVQSAIAQHQESGGEGPPSDAIKAAVQEAFDANGIDPAEIFGKLAGIDASA